VCHDVPGAYNTSPFELFSYDSGRRAPELFFLRGEVDVVGRVDVVVGEIIREAGLEERVDEFFIERRRLAASGRPREHLEALAAEGACTRGGLIYTACDGNVSAEFHTGR
jgi:hypothetical protein